MRRQGRMMMKPIRVADQNEGPYDRIVWSAQFMALPLDPGYREGREQWCPHKHRSEEAAWRCRRPWPEAPTAGTGRLQPAW